MPWDLIAAVEIFCKVLSFSCMRADKRKAMRHTRRIPEKTLLLLTVLGPMGTLAAMCFPFRNGRHKSRKPVFWVIDILSILQHLVLYAALIFVSK